jgi:hypothetical protein
MQPAPPRDPDRVFGSGRSVCLFAQYHPDGVIPSHTRRYLGVLARCGLRVCVAVSGARRVAEGDAAFLASIGGVGQARANKGLDFGAWRDLLGAGCAEGADCVVFANDSVFGPYGPLAPVLAAMQGRGLDAWGLVESNERVWHLQSWFLCLTASALRSAAVRRVFAQDFGGMSKEEIILHGELGLSTALLASGLRVGSAWGEGPRMRRLLPVNPSHFDWRAMLESGGVPFIKAELLRDNPANIAWLPGWRLVLGRLPDGGVAEVTAAIGRDPPVRRARLHRLVLNALLTRDRAAAVRALVGVRG